MGSPWERLHIDLDVIVPYFQCLSSCPRQLSLQCPFQCSLQCSLQKKKKKSFVLYLNHFSTNSSIANILRFDTKCVSVFFDLAIFSLWETNPSVHKMGRCFSPLAGYEPADLTYPSVRSHAHVLLHLLVLHICSHSKLCRQKQQTGRGTIWQ